MVGRHCEKIDSAIAEGGEMKPDRRGGQFYAGENSQAQGDTEGVTAPRECKITGQWEQQNQQPTLQYAYSSISRVGRIQEEIWTLAGCQNGHSRRHQKKRYCGPSKKASAWSVKRRILPKEMPEEFVNNAKADNRAYAQSHGVGTDIALSKMNGRAWDAEEHNELQDLKRGI